MELSHVNFDDYEKTFDIYWIGKSSEDCLGA